MKIVKAHVATSVSAYNNARSVGVIATIFLTFLFLFLFAFSPVDSGDVWWHLKTGQWIWTHGHVPSVDPFTFNNEAIPWVCIHWLGSLILFLVNEAGGLVGLKILKSFVLIASVGIFFLSSRRSLPITWFVLVALLVAYGLIPRLLVRPDIFNFIFIPSFLFILFYYEKSSNWKVLFALPILGIIWHNIHFGGFIYGSLLITIFLFSTFLRTFNSSSKKQLIDLGAVLVLYFLSFFVNPYGLEGFLYPFKVFLQPTYISFYETTRLSLESRALWVEFFSLRYLHAHLLLVLAGVVVFLNRKEAWTLALLLLISLLMYLTMSRNSQFFYFVSAFVIAEGARRGDLKEKWGRWTGSFKVNSIILILITSACAWYVVGIYRLNSVYEGRSTPFLSEESDHFTAKAIDLLVKNGIKGPVFSTDLIGNEILWKAYPDLKPFWDCRYLDPTKHAESVKLLQSPSTNWPAMQSKYNFKIAVLHTAKSSYLRLIKYLDKDPKWQLIALYGHVVVYVKQGEFELSDQLNQFQVNLRETEFTPDDNARLNELLARPIDILTSLIPPPRTRIIDVYFEGATLMNLGYYESGLKKLIQSLSISNEPMVRNGVKRYLKMVNLVPYDKSMTREAR